MTKIKGRVITMESSSDDSEDDTVEKQDGQKMSVLKPQMASIFAEVEQSLPSLDFDFGEMSSDSEVSEEPLIFHRSLKSADYLLDEDKDLDTSFGGESLSDKKKSLTSSHVDREDNNNQTTAQPEESGGAAIPSDTSVNLSNWAALERDMQRTESSYFQQMFQSESPSQCEMNSFTTNTTKNVSELKEETNAERQTEPKNKDKFKKFLQPETTTLSLNMFNNIDLDEVLESLNEDNQYGPPRPRASLSDLDSVAMSGRHSGDIGKETEPVDDMTLIEKLAQLSVKQGATGLSEVNPQTGACQQPHIIYNIDNKWTPESANINRNNTGNEKRSKATCSMGTNTSDMSPSVIQPSLSRGSSVTIKKTDTVFIDLRGFEKHREEEKQNIERVQSILQLQNNKNDLDSTDSEDEADKWMAERKKMKQKLESRGVSTDVLPNKPKISPSGKGKNEYKKPNRVINMTERTTRNGNASGDVNHSKTNGDVDEQTRQKELAAKREKDRQMEVARKLREQKEKERQSKIKLAQMLENLRPTASVSGKQPRAEETPTLYDMEASYEPTARTLPGIISSTQTCVLLKVHLSCNGEIILHKNRTTQSVDTGDGLSASYVTLLTWFASLVPDQFTFLQRAAGDKASRQVTEPFYVVGMQQVWMEEKLYLIVAITPTEVFDPKHCHSLKSKKYQGGNPFMQYVHNILTGNTLRRVCPWLEELVSVEVKSPEDEVENRHYTYCPPLPNITDKPLASFIEVHLDPQAAQRIFNMEVGFYWQTVDSEEELIDYGLDDQTVNYETQNTMSLVYKKIYSDPASLMGILIRILQEGLDLAGVRLLYPTAEMLNLTSHDGNSKKSDLELLNNIGPVLALGIRGTFARTIWLDSVGPHDPILARKTDPNSLCAQYGGSSREECLLFCPRNSSRVLSEISRWFGGRVPEGGSIDVGVPYERKQHLRGGSPKNRKGKKGSLTDTKVDEDEIPTQRPLAALTATTKSSLFLVMSPLFPPKAVGIILATCQRRGFQIRGVKRMRLSHRRAESLGIGSDYCSLFCGEKKMLNSDNPSTIILFEKENASHNAASLIEAFMVQLTLKYLMDEIQSNYSEAVGSNHLFHAASYTQDLLNSLGGDFTRCPDYDTQCEPSYVQPVLYTNPELEQIVVVILHGFTIQKSCGIFIGQFLNVTPYSQTPVIAPLSQGMELLALKWLPCLSTSQAKEVTPIEVGNKLWKESIHKLTSEPSLVLALRGVAAFKQLESMVPPGVLNQPNKTSLHKLMSHTAEEAYIYMRLFFNKHEIFVDNQSRPMLPYLPESLHLSKNSKAGPTEGKVSSNIFDIMKSGSQSIKTFLLIKPGALKKHPLSKFLKKIGQEGFKVVGLKLVVIDSQQADTLVQSFEIQNEGEKEKHLSHLISGPCVALCLQRENAVKKLIDIIGPDVPQAARRKSQFLWRGIFGSDSIANGLHGSVNYCQAVNDIELFFPEISSSVLDNSQQEEEVEDSIIDIHYTEHRQLIVNHNTNTSNFEDSTMADIHANLLVQTNCILLCPPLLGLTSKGKGQGCVEVIDSLQSNGFDIVGARMVRFNATQAEQFLCIREAGDFKQVPLLLMGPSIVLAVQRDNAVVAFNSIFESSLQGSEMLKKHSNFIFRCSTIQQAHKLLPFFFDSLMPGSQISITTKEPHQS